MFRSFLWTDVYFICPIFFPILTFTPALKPRHKHSVQASPEHPTLWPQCFRDGHVILADKEFSPGFLSRAHRERCSLILTLNSKDKESLGLSIWLLLLPLKKSLPDIETNRTKRRSNKWSSGEWADHAGRRRLPNP